MNVPLTAQIGELLGEVQAGLIEEVQRRLAAAGYDDIRASHDCVFRHLTSDGVRLRDLAVSSQLTAPAVGQHVDELEGMGYVERVPDPVDRRAKLIRPTRKGAAFMRAAYGALGEIEREWESAVGAESLVRLRDALAEVRALQREPGPQTPPHTE
jgi:DNA-binding MarR family transcriptional regulator